MNYEKTQECNQSGGCGDGPQKQGSEKGYDQGRADSGSKKGVGDKTAMRSAESRIGEKYGRLRLVTVLGRRMYGRQMKTMCEARCDCGKTITIMVESLASGNTKSCGCLQIDASTQTCLARTKHGMTKQSSPYRDLYDIWKGLIRRCHNSRSRAYANYGGRGVRVCEKWRASIEDFIADMGPRPSGASIDRINNDGDYEPGNCRWATRRQQALNTRRNVKINWQGQVMCMSEFAERCGVTRRVISRRLAAGWSADRIAALGTESKTTTRKAVVL